MVYLILKVIHVAAVVIFLGNIITGLFWMRYAIRSKDFGVIAHTMKGIIKSDRLFTIPGVIIIVIGGFSAAIHANIPILRTGWIFWSIVLFTVSGIVFAWKLVPLQQRIFKMMNEKTSAEINDLLWNKFEKDYKAWELWGAVALYAPLVALVLMILKVPVTTIFFE
jgi:uncharacterized membrane protein